jgi:hypothetical protein
MSSKWADPGASPLAILRVSSRFQCAPDFKFIRLFKGLFRRSRARLRLFIFPPAPRPGKSLARARSHRIPGPSCIIRGLFVRTLRFSLSLSLSLSHARTHFDQQPQSRSPGLLIRVSGNNVYARAILLVVLLLLLLHRRARETRDLDGLARPRTVGILENASSSEPFRHLYFFFSLFSALSFLSRFSLPLSLSLSLSLFFIGVKLAVGRQWELNGSDD